MHVEPSGFDFIYNGNIEITNCDLLARNIIVNGNIRMYGQGVINGTSIIKCSGSIHTNGQLEVRGDLTVTNFLDLRAKVLVSEIMTVEDYKVNTYKDFYAFYLSIKKRGELLLSSFVISILIIPK